MGSKGFEDLEVYRIAEEIADLVWEAVTAWDSFARDTVGKQLVRAADSVGANIAEGTGRGTFKDNKHFARVGRGSHNELRHFLRRAYKRGLLQDDEVARIKPLINELGPRLNAYIKSIGRGKQTAVAPPVSNQ